MTDNVSISPGVGAPIATDDIGGVHYQINKLGFGPLDTVSLVTTTNGLPVQIIGAAGLSNAELRAAPVPVSNASLPLPAGASTEATLAALNGKIASLGQALMASSSPVAIASNQSPIPVTGTFWQATQPVSGTVAVSGSVAVTGPLTDAQIRATALPVSLASTTITGTVTTTVSGSVAVTGTFWQATQPVSLASTTITGSVAVTGPLTDTQLRATAVPVSGTVTANAGTGTMAISAASLPLPTGAATETTLAALNTKVTAVNTGAVTISAALPAGTNALGTVSTLDVTASGTITAAAQSVALTLNGKSGAAIQITGTWVGTLQFEGTVDGANWSTVNGVYAGASTPGPTITANGLVRLTPSGLAQLRITATAWTSGTATISIRASDATGGTFLNQSLTAGANVIGKVGIDQTTPGTTNLVAATGTVADGAADSGNSIKIGGVAQDTTITVQANGTRLPLAVNRRGVLYVAAGDYDGTPGADNVGGLTGFSSRVGGIGGAVIPVGVGGFYYNGAGWDRVRGDATAGAWVQSKANSLVSTANSTTANLAAAAVFTGTSEDVSEYSTIMVAVFSSHASATDGLSIQQSMDGTNWDLTDVYTIPAATGKTFNVAVNAKFYRLVYTNGATLTTSLRIQTIHSKAVKRSSSVRAQDGRSNENDFDEVAAMLVGFNGTSWDRLRSTTANGLAVDVTRLPALATGANVIGALTANQTVNNAQIGGVAPLMGNGVTGTGSQRVTIASDNTAFTVNTTPTTPTASIITSAATTNATSIKASAGTLYSITVSNAGAAAAFVKLYNLATAPTVGTSSIALTIPVAASGSVTIPFGAMGMRFGTGIALAITNLVTEADASAVAANQVKVLTSYI